MRLPQKIYFYQVRPPGRSEWARIWLTDDGCFSTVSDYGNYGYWWGSPGGEIRRFLIGLGPDYVLTKLTSGKRDKINGQKSVKRIQEYILSHRRERDWSKERAREEWDLLQEHSDLDDIFNQVHWYEQTTIDCAYEYLVYEGSQQAAAFVRELWPLFVEELRKELEAEREDYRRALIDRGLDPSDPEIAAVVAL